MNTNYPNLIVAGFTRCGTSSLHRYLSIHPDIFMSEKKELQYFNRDIRYFNQQEEYFANFSQSIHKYKGESTPMYAHKAKYDLKNNLIRTTTNIPIQRILNDIPNVKLLISIRNPIDRYISWHFKNYYKGKKLARDIFKHIKSELNDDSNVTGIYVCKYKIHLIDIYNLVEPHQIKFLIFEEWIRDPISTMINIFNWLDIDPIVGNADDYNPINTKDKYLKYNQNLSIRRLYKKYKLGSKLWVPPIKPFSKEDVAKKLRPVFKEDVQYIEDLLERKIKYWH